MTVKRPSVRLIGTGMFLTLTCLSASAATVTSFTSNCGSVPATPAASPGTNAFAVNLPPTFMGITCAIDFFYTSGPATTYNMALTITNNTGSIMTDLEIPLFSIPGDTFTGTPVSSPDLPYDAALSTSTFLVFEGPPNLPISGTEIVDFSFTMPAASNIGGGAFDSVQIIPTFTANTPEPASLAFTGLGLFALGILPSLRRRFFLRQSAPGFPGNALVQLEARRCESGGTMFIRSGATK
jgi:hypothetical protein